MKPKCRLCDFEITVPGDLENEIRQVVDSIPDVEKADGNVYINRLTLCSECEFLRDRTCVKCGCFVQVRAAKKRFSCPLPAGAKWTAEK